LHLTFQFRFCLFHSLKVTFFRIQAFLGLNQTSFRLLQLVLAVVNLRLPVKLLVSELLGLRGKVLLLLFQELALLSELLVGFFVVVFRL
jgi:hypothetical protein